MLVRLKKFMLDVGGKLFRGTFWVEVVKKSLKAAVLSAAEAALKAVGRLLHETAEDVRGENTHPEVEKHVVTSVPVRQPEPEEEEEQWNGTPWDRPAKAPEQKPERYGHTAPIGRTLLEMSEGQFTVDPENDTDPELDRHFLNHMLNRKS